MEPQRYIGTKIIEATPMNRGEYNQLRGWTVPPDEDPRDEGQLISYAGGFIQWIPNEVFEKEYQTLDKMTFGQALEALKMGHKVARTGWNGKNMWIVLMPELNLPPHSSQSPGAKVNDRTAKHIGVDTALHSQPYIAMWTAQGKWQPGWLASQNDMLADDWRVL